MSNHWQLEAMDANETIHEFVARNIHSRKVQERMIELRRELKPLDDQALMDKWGLKSLETRYMTEAERTKIKPNNQPISSWREEQESE